MLDAVPRQTPWPAAITADVTDKIVAFLAPLFLGTLAGDIATARQAASATLLSYGAQTDRELRLVALIIAFSFGALDALGRAAGPDLPVNQVLRLRGNANALNRATHQNENRLQEMRRQSAAPTQPAPDQPAEAEPVHDLPDSSDTADLIAFARANLNPTAPAAPPVAPPHASSATACAPISRQQRRAAERQAEKIRLRRQEAARLAERASARMAASARTATPAHDAPTARAPTLPEAGPQPDLHRPAG